VKPKTLKIKTAAKVSFGRNLPLSAL